tara:strand:+ start:75 stop:299 length:225 start_codon:yes stop_codon:yes gene_type:complete
MNDNGLEALKIIKQIQGEVTMNKDSKLDELVSEVFKELYNIEQQVLRLRLLLGHLEERAKKDRDKRKILEHEIL